MILKHDEAEPLELSSGPYGDVEMESLNGRWISQSAMAPAKVGNPKEGRGGRGRLKRFSFSPELVHDPRSCMFDQAPRWTRHPCLLIREALSSSQSLTG